MKTYIVQLENHDDVISTRDKISWSKARRVVLVWPRRGSLFAGPDRQNKILERRVDLMLIQRYCQQLGIQLALVTSSAPVREVARDLGIPVFSSSLRAQSATWRRIRKRRRFQWPGMRKLQPPDQLRAWHGRLRARLMWSRWVRAPIFLLGITAFLMLVFFFMPGARVELSPARQGQNLTIEVWANDSILAPNLSGGVPAYPVTVVVEVRDLAPSTGRTFVSDQTATGEIELTNLTDQAVTVPAGSVALTVEGSPVRFLTMKPADLPAGPGEKTRVPVRAALPGLEGNVRAETVKALEGPLGLRVKISNPQPTSGGSMRMVPSPSTQDYDQLRDQLLTQLQQTAVQELQSQMQPGQFLVYQSIQQKSILDEQRDPEAAMPADQLQLTLRVEYQAWMIKESDLGVVGLSALDANLPAGFEPVTDSLRVDRGAEPVLDHSGTARWTITVERDLVARWSRDRVISLVQGRSPQEAGAALQSALPLDGVPRLELFPAWWIRLPFLPFRIEVVGS